MVLIRYRTAIIAEAKTMNNNYSIVIQWSEQNNCFVASLPEWEHNTCGKTYEEVLQNAQQAIASLVRSSLSQGKPLPQAQVFQLPAIK